MCQLPKYAFKEGTPSVRSKIRFIWHTIIMIIETSIAGSLLCPRPLRRLLYNLCGNHVKTNHVNAHCTVGGSGLSIGEGSYVSFNNFFDMSDKIHIGNNVYIGMRCNFITSTHKIEGSVKRAGPTITAPITIDDGCWIGGGCNDTSWCAYS